MARKTMDNEGYQKYVQVGVTAQKIAADPMLKEMMMTQLAMTRWEGCYVKLRCALCDRDEWNFVEAYFRALEAGNIKDCKVYAALTELSCTISIVCM